jgi:6-phosphogluconolactonase/glucosamine-6-phosphate isomerase/deaminase
MVLPIYRIATSTDVVALYIANQINAKLRAGKRVLWLVPGGSAIEVAVSASRQISGVASDLSITLTDERPGPIGHPGSNWRQLKTAGFDYERHNYYEVLQNKPEDQETTAYGAWLERALGEDNDYKIGLFGVGADGHTAGILPGVTPTTAEKFAGYYSDPQRQRISINPAGIAALDEVIVFAIGEDKRAVIDGLAGNVDASVIPAQHLKQAGKLVVYNDHNES